MSHEHVASRIVVGVLSIVLVVPAIQTAAKGKPDRTKYQWSAMIVEGTVIGGSCDGSYQTVLRSGLATDTLAVGDETYCGHVYTDGDNAKIWANWVNRRYTVFGFHLEPGDSFELTGLDLVNPEFSDFDGNRLLCSSTTDEGCVEDFLNGQHPNRDFYDVGFAFHSPVSCDFKYDEQVIGGDPVQMSLSIWLEAHDYQRDICKDFDYNIRGWNDPGWNCDCSLLSPAQMISLTRLDENVWKLTVESAFIDNLMATDCEVVQIRKNKTQRIPLYPMENGFVDNISFELLFIRSRVSN
jgi:hypothetical protein